MHTVDAAELRYGFTLDDLDHMTRAALMRNRTMAAPFEDRYDAAHFAIVEALYSADQWPRRDELITVGANAISRMIRLEQRHHGIDRQNMERYAQGLTHRGWMMFWDAHLHAPDHADYVVERIALGQVLAALPPGARSIIAARAATGDNGLAADRVAKSRKSFTTMLGGARRRFRAMWFEGEAVDAWVVDQGAPTGASGTTTQRAMAVVRRRKRDGRPRVSRARDRCARGHIWDATNTVSRADGSRYCRVCAADARTRRAELRRAGVTGRLSTGNRYGRTRSEQRAIDRREAD